LKIIIQKTRINDKANFYAHSVIHHINIKTS